MSLRLADRAEIIDLVARYNHAIDAFEAETWAGLFTKDGALLVNGDARATGHAALAEYVARRRLAGSPILRHWTANILLEGDSASVRLRAYVMAFVLDNGLGAPAVMGEYDDDVVQTGGGWKFRVRRLTIVAESGASKH